jgi:hypothetical protein
MRMRGRQREILGCAHENAEAHPDQDVNRRNGKEP